jgi:hypothetical protein
MSDVDYSLIFNDEQEWTEKKLRAILKNERANPTVQNGARAELNRRASKVNVNQGLQDFINPTGGFMGNITNSVLGYGVDVTEGLVDLAANLPQIVSNPIDSLTGAAESIGNYANDRYGFSGGLNGWNTAARDPFGTVMDASGIGSLMRLPKIAGNGLIKGARKADVKDSIVDKVDSFVNSPFSEAVDQGASVLQKLDPASMLVDGVMASAFGLRNGRAADTIAADYGQISGVNDTITTRTVVDDLIDNDLAPTPDLYEVANNRRLDAKEGLDAGQEDLKFWDDTARAAGIGIFPVADIIADLNRAKRDIKGDPSTQKQAQAKIDEAIAEVQQYSKDGYILPEDLQRLKSNWQFNVNWNKKQRDANSASNEAGDAGTAQGRESVAGVYANRQNSASPMMEEANATYSDAARRQENIRSGAMSDLRSNAEVTNNRWFNILLKGAERGLTGQDKFERAQFYRSLEQGNYMDAFLDHTNIGAVGSTRRAGYFYNQLEDEELRRKEEKSWIDGTFPTTPGRRKSRY